MAKKATLGNKRKLAAILRETRDFSMNSQGQNASLPGLTEEYITQFSEEIGSRVFKKISQEFSRTEFGILGALSTSDELLLNPHVWTLSRTVPGTSRKNDLENREPTGEYCQGDLHPEVEFSACQTSNWIDCHSKETSHRDNLLWTALI